MPRWLQTCQSIIAVAGCVATFSLQADLMGDDLPALPMPSHTSTVPNKLTIHDAILIALRNSPGIESAELQRVLDKYSILVAYNAFFPTYTMGANLNLPNKGKASYSISPTMTLNTPIGTSVNVNYSKTFSGGLGTTTVKISQPLLKGFGYTYNMISFDNAMDQVLLDRLTYKSSVMGVVDSVVKSYRSLVQDYNSLKTNEATVKQNTLQFQQYQAKFKAGQMSRSDLIQQQASLEGIRLSLVKAKNSLQQDYKSFLQTLGLDSNVKVSIEQRIANPMNYKIPSLQSAIKMALHSNISYMQAVIGMRKTERSLLSAKNALKWSLDLVANKTFGSNNTQTSENSGPDLGLSLSIPINDLADKQSLLGAKIALINAKNSLQNDKRNLVSQVTEKIESLQNDRVSLKIAQEQVQLQEQTVSDTRLKIRYGKATMFELTTQQNSLLTQQISLIGSKINFLNDILSLQDMLGTTLEHWGIRLKY